MSGILSQILVNKKKEIEESKKFINFDKLVEEAVKKRKNNRNFSKELSGDLIKLIAEIKKASPSKGVLCRDFKPSELAQIYADSGASAISVLTEKAYFQGDIEHLKVVREKVTLPVLRKDFVFDPFQIYESVIYGTDAILLIVAILDEKTLKELYSLAYSLGLECLVEVHKENEIYAALDCGAELIGINNRDLNSFTTDINVTQRLRPLIPDNCIVVSESGIKDNKDIKKLRLWGVNAVLIGEALVTAEDISSKIKELMSS